MPDVVVKQQEFEAGSVDEKLNTIMMLLVSMAKQIRHMHSYCEEEDTVN